MTHWALVGRTSGGVRGFQMRETMLLEDIKAQDGAGFVGPKVIIGEGAAETLPAQILPGNGSSLPNWEQENPPDVISGWVRLWIAGVLAERPNWDGVICAHHGDLTHWLLISAEEAVSAQTTLTLRLATALGGAKEVCTEALGDTMSQPERLASHLRKAEVSGDAKAITGHLLGAELAATRPYWLGREVLVLSQSPEAQTQALVHQSVPCEAHSPEALLAPGLAALAKQLGFAD